MAILFYEFTIRGEVRTTHLDVALLRRPTASNGRGPPSALEGSFFLFRRWMAAVTPRRQTLCAQGLNEDSALLSTFCVQVCLEQEGKFSQRPAAPNIHVVRPNKL